MLRAETGDGEGLAIIREDRELAEAWVCSAAGAIRLRRMAHSLVSLCQQLCLARAGDAGGR